ncbi:MAG: SurA N-terminal domain-containing protein [Flavobacteriales bacterium]|nr:SurA N-terminal domain-containing protein [Flavobacteriales bacterium]
MVIGKIREKSTLLLIMIGGALLAFILGDLFSSSNFLVSGSQTEIGVVAGEAIEGRDFEARVQQAIDNYKAQSGQTNVNATTTDQLREQTWNQLLRDIVMDREMEELGVTVTADEIYDMVQGNKPHPQVVQAFTDPNTGQFDNAQVFAFLQRMDDDPETKARWVRFEHDIAKLRRSEKYFNLIKKGLYTTSQEAGNDYAAKNSPANIRLVVKRYASVADDEFTVTDEDVKKYYNANLKKYEQEASRDVEFVTFNVDPSKEDIEKVQHWAEGVKGEFETAENDTLFVNRESDVKFNAMWTAKGSLAVNIDSVMFHAPKGYVHGPYRDGKALKLAKLIGVKMSPDSVKARHILITPNKYGPQTKTTADSIYELVKSRKEDFAALAGKVSEDPGSGAQGGDLGWFAEGQMVPSFNDACFDGKKGDIKLVQSQFGFHIIEVLDQKGKSEKRAVAVIQRNIEPSSKTYQVVYGQADEFARAVKSVESFDELVNDKGLDKRLAPNLKENDRTIAGLDSPREVVRFAFNAKEGDVSKVIEMGNTFVVAVLTAIRDKGNTPMSDIREELEAEVRKEKKAEHFIREFAAANATDIQALADKMNLPVEVKENVSFSAASIPGLGREPEVIGTSSVLAPGKLSGPVKGQQGVFVMVVDGRAETPALDSYAASARTLNASLSSRVDFEVLEALKKKADVKDNRSKFY